MTENKETKYGFTEVGISFTVASEKSIASLQKDLEEAWKGWFDWQREIYGLSEPKKEGNNKDE